MSDTTPKDPSEAEKALQSQLDEAVVAKTESDAALASVKEELANAVKRAETAEKALAKAGVADPKTRAKKMKADYQKGMNYQELSAKYKVTIAEVIQTIEVPEEV